MKKADQLMLRVIADPSDGKLVNEFLREFGRGYPVKSLRQMLKSDEPRVVGVGMWLVSELGSSAKALLDDTALFLQHPATNLRFYAIDSVLTCASGRDGKVLAEVVMMLNDVEKIIRLKVMNFLSLASKEQLQAALKYFEKYLPNSPHFICLRWLTAETGQAPADSISFLQNENPIHRKYGTVLATRMVKVNRDSDNPFYEPLRLASCSSDTDVNEFAQSMIKISVPKPMDPKDGPWTEEKIRKALGLRES